MRQCLVPVFCVAALLLGGCVSTASQLDFGVQPGHISYVPARIAMVPCRAWPAGDRFDTLPLTNVKETDVVSLCAAVDQYVLGGFKDQPYMKGFSAKFVAETLTKLGGAATLDNLPQLWSHRDGDCHECKNAPSFYASSLAKRPEWLAWLNKTSQNVRNADALLLPFLTYAYERRYDDRGLAIAERAAGVVLLLIDTNNGELLWAGGREVSVPTKQLTGGNVGAATSQDLPLPPWSSVQERLLTEDLWRAFPGREVF